MPKRSVLVKILVLMVLLIALPALMPALDIACEPPYCQGGCPASNMYDCTSEWIWESWANFQAACAIWYAGYSLLICCWA